MYFKFHICGELITQLPIAKDINYLTDVEQNTLHEKRIAVSRQINGFIEYPKKTNIPGHKYLYKREQDALTFLNELKNISKRK